MYKEATFRWLKHLDFIILDLFSLALSLIIAYIIRFGNGDILLQPVFTKPAAILLIMDFFVIISANTLSMVIYRGYMVEIEKTVKNVVLVYASSSLVLFALEMSSDVSRLAFFTSAGFYAPLSYALRVVYKIIFKRYIGPKNGSRIFIITENAYLDGLRKNLKDNWFAGMNTAGICITDAAAENVPELPERLRNRVSADEVVDWIRRNWVDEVLLILTEGEELRKYENAFLAMGITVHIGLEGITDFIPSTGHKTVGRVGGYDTITVSWKRMTYFEAFLKRTTDIIGSIIGLLITAVLTLFLGPIIYAQSPGPVFYTQERIGCNGRMFKIYKFRSMYPDADARKKEFMEKNIMSDGMMFKLDWDPRIIGNKELPDGTRKTGIGEFIRKTSLDEFPQFLNVLKGDMSLVGTRPPTPDEWEKYEDHHRARLGMRPGITGMWQVSGRSRITDFEEVVRLDTRYISEWSLALDIKILLKTVIVVLLRIGSM